MSLASVLRAIWEKQISGARLRQPRKVLPSLRVEQLERRYLPALSPSPWYALTGQAPRAHAGPDIRIDEGQPIRFRASVSGMSNLRLRWYFGDGTTLVGNVRPTK